MILCNVEMQEAMATGRLIIEPQPQPLRLTEGQSCPYDAHSVNLRLGQELSIPMSGPYSYDLGQGGDFSEFLSRNAEKRSIPATGFTLEKFQFVLGITLEYISLPIDHEDNQKTGTCLAARIEGRSSIARCGILVHFTAPTGHPGFDGTLTLEIINLGPTSFVLRPGMPIAQLIVEEVKGIPFEKPDHTFKGQQAPEGRLGEQLPHRGGRGKSKK
jgi:dCTP deaminase